ncbi:MAG TPA: CRISPR-associated endonuclease Cas2 [Thermomicrobiales bacterium]|nr:CRISPR-associated endonuclease Cas2 [Thermomicrobiales bacterium]
MEVLIAYDVATDTPAGQRRLRKVAQVCVAHGQRVQKSVFECSLTDAQLEEMLYRLLAIIDDDHDSLRVYRLREPRERYTAVYGVRPAIDLREPLII